MMGEECSRTIVKSILNALHYLHEELNIVHRDLKPQNILLNSLHDYTPKLIDFGFSAVVPDHGLKSTCGSPKYMAPEQLKKGEYYN